MKDDDILKKSSIKQDCVPKRIVHIYAYKKMTETAHTLTKSMRTETAVLFYKNNTNY